MVLVDWSLHIFVAALCLLWWFRSRPRRLATLVAVGVITLALSLSALLSYRWQAAFAAAASAYLLLIVSLGRIWPQLIKQGIGHVFNGVLLVALGLSSMLLLYWFPVVDLPEPSGPYKVGMRDFMLSDDSRIGTHQIAPNESRRLAVRVWYPSDQVEGLQRQSYYTDLEARTTARELGQLTPLGAPFFPYLKHSQTHSYVNAPLAEGLQNLPVVTFSHGYRGSKGQNTILMEDLASHGYLAFSLQHTYDSSATVFPNGDVVNMDPELLKTVSDYREQVAEHGYARDVIDAYTEPDLELRRKAVMGRYELDTSHRLVYFSAPIWVEDQLFLSESLAAGEVPDSVADLAAAGDFRRAGRTGMSFGGSVAAATCAIDRRCVAVANIDGEDRHQTLFNRHVPVPMLMYSSDTDLFVDAMPGGEDEEGQNLTSFIYERHETTGLRPDLYRIWIENATHYALSDFAIFLSRNDNPLTKDLFGPVDGLEVNQISVSLIRGFFDKHLRGLENDFPNAQMTPQAGLHWHDQKGVRDWWIGVHPEDRVVRVTIQSTEGQVGLALYPERAPTEVAKFLGLVEQGTLDGSGLVADSIQAGGREVHVLAWDAPADAPQTGTPSSIAGEAPAIPFAYGTLALLPPDGQGSDERWIVHLGYGEKLRSFDPVEFGEQSGAALIVFGRVYYGLLGLENARYPEGEDGQSTRQAAQLIIEQAQIEQ